MMEGKELVKPRLKKGFWKPEEDFILKKYVETHGEGNWTVVSKKSGLLRGAKSCRLRWKNYLRPNIKRGMMSEDEKDLIIRLHKLLGNRWSLIAGRLPGRTDNEVKNYWNTHLNKRPSAGDQITQTDDEKRQLSLMSSQAMQDENQQAIITAKEGETLDTVIDNLKINNMDHGMNVMPSPLINPECSPLMFFHNYETTFMPIFDNLVFLEPFGSSAVDELMRETIFQL